MGDKNPTPSKDGKAGEESRKRKEEPRKSDDAKKPRGNPEGQSQSNKADEGKTKPKVDPKGPSNGDKNCPPGISRITSTSK